VHNRLSRRALVQGAFLTAAAGILAACGGTTTAPTQAPAAIVPTTQAPAPTPASAAASPTPASAAASPTVAPAAAPTQAPTAIPATAVSPTAVAVSSSKVPTTVVEVIAQSGWMAPSPIDYSDVNQAINASLQQVGLQLQVNTVADFQQKPPLMFASGEKFDFLFDAPWFNMLNFATNAYLAPIEGYFTSFPKLSEAYDATTRRANYMKGHLLGLPTWGFLYQSGFGMMLREDLRKAHDLPVPTNWDTMEALLMDVKKAIPSITPSATFFRGWEGYRIHYQLVGAEPDAGQIVNLDTGVKVVNRFESDVMRQDYLQRQRLFKNGLVPKNIADKAYVGDQFFQSGKSFANVQDLGELSSQNTSALKANGVTGDVLFYDLAGLTDNSGYKQVTDLKQWNFQEFNKNGQVESALAFFEWILGSQDNIDLWTLGIKGKHWIDTGNNTFQNPPGQDPSTLYHRPWYLSGIPMKYLRLPADLPQSDINILKLKSTWDDQHYIQSPLLGFDFDPEPLKTALAKNTAVITDKAGALEVGQAPDVDAALKTLNQALKAAGLDEELAQKQAQVDAFVKANQAQLDKYNAAIKK
jgi:putative aldouronate transport system substrate-binding protein